MHAKEGHERLTLLLTARIKSAKQEHVSFMKPEIFFFFFSDGNTMDLSET